MQDFIALPEEVKPRPLNFKGNAQGFNETTYPERYTAQDSSQADEGMSCLTQIYKTILKDIATCMKIRETFSKLEIRFSKLEESISVNSKPNLKP